MIAFITAHIADIAITSLLLVILTLVIRTLIRDKKAGRSSCGGNCTGCSMGGCCHAQAGCGSADKKNVQTGGSCQWNMRL